MNSIRPRSRRGLKRLTYHSIPRIVFRGLGSLEAAAGRSSYRHAEVLVRSLYSDLREAMSMENRYFTSDLSSLS
jgi:hypothetical protein